jgi:predicted esterase
VASDAYLVLPAGSADHASAGIVWFHWLEQGAPTANRTEFLDEASQLAGRGVVSLLVDGQFPWHESPRSIAHDVAAVQDELTMLRRGHDLLASRAEVDSSRIALVGHDFGAMYSSVVFGSDPSTKGLVMMSPTARWADWFIRYWSISDDPAAYRAAMAPLDPVTALAHTDGRPVLLQFARSDQYVPQTVAAEITAAVGSSADRRTYDTGHELNQAARTDRDNWLTDLLHLAPAN